MLRVLQILRVEELLYPACADRCCRRPRLDLGYVPCAGNRVPLRDMMCISASGSNINPPPRGSSCVLTRTFPISTELLIKWQQMA
jgi:hypothetical protein